MLRKTEEVGRLRQHNKAGTKNVANWSRIGQKPKAGKRLF
jgi:hypothetical protein